MLISWHPLPFKTGRENCYATGWKTSHINLTTLGRVTLRAVWSSNIWRDGIRNKEHFFQNWFCVLDFDDGEMSLESAVQNYFADFQHIIGTTKSHQIAKDDKPPCDRFRVIVPWEKPINDVLQYEYNMDFYIDNYFADEHCKDSGRQFFPCNKIVSTNFDKSGELMPVKRLTKKAIESAKKIESLDNTYSRNYINKILSGKIIKGSRNQTIFKLGCEAAKIGIALNDLVSMIENSNAIEDYQKTFSSRELIAAISSGYRKTSTQ